VAIPVVSYAAGVLAAMHDGSVVYQTRADRGGDGSEGIKQGDSPLLHKLWQRITGLEAGMLSGCIHHMPPLGAGGGLRMIAVI